MDWSAAGTSFFGWVDSFCLFHIRNQFSGSESADPHITITSIHHQKQVKAGMFLPVCVCWQNIPYTGWNLLKLCGDYSDSCSIIQKNPQKTSQVLWTVSVKMLSTSFKTLHQMKRLNKNKLSRGPNLTLWVIRRSSSDVYNPNQNGFHSQRT